MRRHIVSRALAWQLAACTLSPSAILASEVPLGDHAALALADTADGVAMLDKPWHLTVEGSAGAVTERGESTVAAARGALDFSLDQRVTRALRLVVRDRIDDFSQGNANGYHTINTWKEGYLAWQPWPQAMLDLGRVNVRQGVATGYNPTDWFREGAIRAVSSVSPESLRQNRQGSVIARGQWLWEDVTVFALFSPDLGGTSGQAPFSPDLASTNGRNRYLTGISAALTERIQTQLLLQGGAGQSLQAGLNLSVLATDAVTAYLEWSGGQDRSQLNKALPIPPDTAFRQRLSAGGTWTLDSRISATLEFQYNSAAPDGSQWDQFWTLPPQARMRYNQYLANAQELATRSGAFLFLNWRDALMPRVDLSAMARLDLVDRSSMQWLELRYRQSRWDIALQWQNNAGPQASTYGSLPRRQSLMLLADRYF